MPVFAFADEIEKPSIVSLSQIISSKINFDDIVQLAKEKNYQSRIDQVREKAFEYLGVPYVWGGTTPYGFDCSGFVQYVFAECGIDIPRTTYDQIWCGQSVSLGELVCGDLVFFGNHHVAIYIGDNQYIHAPQSGDVVRVQDMDTYYPTSAQRFIFPMT